MLGKYSRCSFENLPTFENLYFAIVLKRLARDLAENSEESVSCGPTQDCTDIILL